MGGNSNISELELMQARVRFVPEGWKFLNVGKTFKIRNNLRKPINEDEREAISGEYPYYGPTKIQGYINTFEQDGSYALIGEDGDHFLKFSTQSMTQLVEGKCTVNNHAHIIEGTEIACREWFYYYFMHRDIFSFLSRQGAGRYKLNKASLEKIPLLVPPISEQKKIAQILSTWDKAIVTTEKLLEISQQQKKALMQQLLTGKKRFPEHEDEWKLLKLNSLIKEIKKEKVLKPEVIELLTVKLHNKGTAPSGKYPNPTEGGRPYYKRYAGELIIGRQNLHNGGVAIVGHECNGLIASNAISSFEALTNANIDYVYSLMSTKHFKFTIDNLASGTGQKEVGTNELLSLKVCVPSKQEQVKIASVLSIADKEIKALQDKINHLKDEKKALMQQLLTGKRRVKVIQ